MSKLKEWCKNNYWIFIILCILEQLFIISCYFDGVRSAVLKIVLDSRGDSNWAMITSLTAIIAIISSWISNNKKIKANIVSKSRIEWIQEVRKVSVDFFSACYNVLSLIPIIKIGESKSVKPQGDAIASSQIEFNVEKGKNAEIYSGDKRYFIEEQSKVKKFGELITLYLGPDSSGNNEFIVYLVDWIVLQISDNNKIFEQGEVLVNDVIKDLKNILRVYFKVEWKRSIGQIDDKNVDNQLLNNRIYKDVFAKYKVEFENRNDESR